MLLMMMISWRGSKEIWGSPPAVFGVFFQQFLGFPGISTAGCSWEQRGSRSREEMLRFCCSPTQCQAVPPPPGTIPLGNPPSLLPCPPKPPLKSKDFIPTSDWGRLLKVGVTPEPLVSFQISLWK